jgi:cell surface protein SprA
MLSSEINGTGDVIETAWGIVKPFHQDSYFPVLHPELYDTGLDELLDEDEVKYFSKYLEDAHQICDANAFNNIANDPSNDDYHYYLGDDYDESNYKVCDRYKSYNGQESNSFPLNYDLENTISSRTPDNEDLNENGILDNKNDYYEYHISINKDDFLIGNNYIVDMFPAFTQLQNGETTRTDYYHFRIPLTDFTTSYGNPDPSSNPKFIRLFVTGFTSPSVFRFINLELTEELVDYSQWQ